MKAAFKPVPKENAALFRIEKQETDQEFDYPWHYHPEYELTFISNSHGVRYVGNNLENYFDHDLVLLGSNLPHCWINSTGSTTGSFPRSWICSGIPGRASSSVRKWVRR